MLFHIAALKDLPDIVENGLQLGSGGKFGAAYGKHSKGKVFFTVPGGAKFWWERVGVALEGQTDSPEEGWIPIILRTEQFEIDDTYEDKPGTQDARHEAGYVTEEVDPEDLQLWDGENWVYLEDLDEADAEAMIEAAADAADQEEVDGETIYWMKDDMFWPGRRKLEQDAVE